MGRTMRRFNRLVIQRAGGLYEHFLGRARPLEAATYFRHARLPEDPAGAGHAGTLPVRAGAAPRAVLEPGEP